MDQNKTRDDADDDAGPAPLRGLPPRALRRPSIGRPSGRRSTETLVGKPGTCEETGEYSYHDNIIVSLSITIITIIMIDIESPYVNDGCPSVNSIDIYLIYPLVNVCSLLSLLWKITICCGENQRTKSQFSIAMLVYQRMEEIVHHQRDG